MRWLLISSCDLRVNFPTTSPRSNGQRDFTTLLYEPCPLILLLGDFSALKLLPVQNFSWVCSHSIRKELSLLSFVNSDSFRDLCALFLCSTSNNSQSVEVTFRLCALAATVIPVSLCSDKLLRLLFSLHFSCTAPQPKSTSGQMRIRV
jgi:hypothetical protein